MRLRGAVVTAALVVGTMGVVSGTAYADPAIPAPGVVNYETKLVDNRIVTTIDAGSFVVRSDGQAVDIADPLGGTLASLPLSFSANGVAHPYVYEVSDAGQTLTLTPDMDPAKASLRPITPVASLLENQRAQNAFATQFGIASAIGGFTGSIIGLIVGCVIGFPAALTVALIPAWLGACAVGAGVGAVLGTFIVGGPTLVIAGIDLVNTLTAPPGTTKWNYPDQVVVTPQ